MNRIKALLAVILPAVFLAISAPAAAQQSDAGWYIGGSYGMTSFNIDTSSAPGARIDDSDSGFKIFGGFQFTKHWGVEVGYVDFGKAGVSGVGNGDIGVTALTLAGTGTLPLGENFALLGKVGLAQWDSSVSVPGFTGDSGSDMYYGVGMRYSFNKNMSVQLELEQFDTKDDSVMFTSVGLRYKF